MKIPWTLDGALPLIRQIGNIAREQGFRVALRGSVLERGESEHDLDLFFTVEEQETTFNHVQHCVDAMMQLTGVDHRGEIGGGSRPICTIWLLDGRHIELQFDQLHQR
jgi:hypothetical protein